jgi:Cof subfamily protein (haloacid dehalogenase superfamily)
MNLSQIKLVATDMDGTLLNNNHEVSKLFFKLFEELKKHNVLFVAASGRPLYSINEKLNAIKNDIFIVAENGGLITQGDTLILSTPFKKDSLFDIESLIKQKKDIFPIYCTRSKAYSYEISASTSPVKSLTEYYPNIEFIKNVSDIKEEIIKIALYNAEDSEKYIYPFFKHFEPEYKVIVSGKQWLDISNNLANKGNAIQLLQKKFNISPDETLVFGDYNNDIDMLKQATYSFAMANAHSKVLETANFKTKSNNDFGVELILEKLLVAKSKHQKQ